MLKHHEAHHATSVEHVVRSPVVLDNAFLFMLFMRYVMLFLFLVPLVHADAWDEYGTEDFEWADLTTQHWINIPESRIRDVPPEWINYVPVEKLEHVPPAKIQHVNKQKIKRAAADLRPSQITQLTQEQMDSEVLHNLGVNIRHIGSEVFADFMRTTHNTLVSFDFSEGNAVIDEQGRLFNRHGPSIPLSGLPDAVDVVALPGGGFRIGSLEVGSYMKGTQIAFDDGLVRITLPEDIGFSYELAFPDLAFLPLRLTQDLQGLGPRFEALEDARFDFTTLIGERMNLNIQVGDAFVVSDDRMRFEGVEWNMQDMASNAPHSTIVFGANQVASIEMRGIPEPIPDYTVRVGDDVFRPGVNARPKQLRIVFDAPPEDLSSQTVYVTATMEGEPLLIARGHVELEHRSAQGQSSFYSRSADTTLYRTLGDGFSYRIENPQDGPIATILSGSFVQLSRDGVLKADVLPGRRAAPHEIVYRDERGPYFEENILLRADGSYEVQPLLPRPPLQVDNMVFAGLIDEQGRPLYRKPDDLREYYASGEQVEGEVEEVSFDHSFVDDRFVSLEPSPPEPQVIATAVREGEAQQEALLRNPFQAALLTELAAAMDAGDVARTAELQVRAKEEAIYIEGGVEEVSPQQLRETATLMLTMRAEPLQSPEASRALARSVEGVDLYPSERAVREALGLLELERTGGGFYDATTAALSEVQDYLQSDRSIGDYVNIRTKLRVIARAKAQSGDMLDAERARRILDALTRVEGMQGTREEIDWQTLAQNAGIPP